MTDYRVLVHDASTGTPLAELPLSGLSYSRVLSGCGSLSGTMPVWHPLATETFLGQLRGDPDRELTVIRDGAVDWNGPLTGTSATLSGDTIQVNAREASWYLGKRVLEEDKDYTGDDVFDAVRDLVSSMKNKTATGDDDATLGSDILADLPRWSVMAGTAGAPLGSVTFAAAGRHTYQECFDFIAADPTTGFEWKMDYSTSSTRQSPHRTLTMGYPGLGSTLTTQLSERRLSDYGRDLDWERAATRVHVIGSGYTKTLQSNVSVTNGVILLETVDDYSDTSNADFVDSRAKDLRRILRPAVRVPTASFRPSVSLPYDFCDLGDVVPFEITWPDVLTINSDTRRVIEKRTDVGDDGDEVVTMTYNDVLTDLGT